MARALAAALIVLMMVPLVLAQTLLPGGCDLDEGKYVCSWLVDTGDPSRLGGVPADPFGQGAVQLVKLDIPVFPRALAVVSVEAERGGARWECTIERTEAEGVETILSRCGAQRDLSPGLGPVIPATHETTLPLLTEATMHHAIRLDVPLDGSLYRVVYVAEPLPDGVHPERPAATRADPHVEDIPRDAPRGAVDVLAVWFDDSSVGDGLFEVQVAVRDLNDSGLPEPLGVPDPTGRRDIPHVDIDVLFTVGDASYRMRWSQHARVEVPQTCTFFSMDADARPVAPGGVTAETQTTPVCTFDWENSTLHAAIPERSVGNPSAGERFTEVHVQGMVSDTGRLEEIVDQTEGERYPFALGGPAVWDVLNPRLAVPEPAPQAWYVQPLAAENLPNTLQVGGTVVAAFTFLVGLVLVSRRRRRLRALLAEVDAVAKAHPDDAAVGLVALGRLEESFDDRLRKGAITDAEYQVASQRIATTATRLALRRDAGLDDGVPDVREARR